VADVNFTILGAIAPVDASIVPRKKIVAPSNDTKNGFAATFQCTKRKMNETNGKNMQLRPHKIPARNVAMRNPILPIKKTTSPDINRIVLSTAVPEPA